MCSVCDLSGIFSGVHRSQQSKHNVSYASAMVWLIAANSMTVFLMGLVFNVWHCVSQLTRL